MMETGVKWISLCWQMKVDRKTASTSRLVSVTSLVCNFLWCHFNSRSSIHVWIFSNLIKRELNVSPPHLRQTVIHVETRDIQTRERATSVHVYNRGGGQGANCPHWQVLQKRVITVIWTTCFLVLCFHFRGTHVLYRSYKYLMPVADHQPPPPQA